MSDEEEVKVKPMRGIDAGHTDAAERRRYFRIKDQVALKYRIIPAQQLSDAVQGRCESTLNLINLASTFASNSRQMVPVLRRVRELQPELGRYLAMVNEKLDLLARALSMAENELVGEQPQKVCLSAGGISFDVERRLAPGASLEIKLLMFPSLLYVLTFGTVTRCQPTSDQQPFRYRVAVEFSYITEEDRELLIQHIVQRESSRLRERRIGGEEGRAVDLTKESH